MKLNIPERTARRVNILKVYVNNYYKILLQTIIHSIIYNTFIIYEKINIIFLINI